MIGFIGLGIMGTPMAKNLLKAGYPMLVYDLDASRVRSLARQGAKGASGIGEIAALCDTVITMLPDSPQVQEVVLAEAGLIPHLRPGSVVIDMSSIDPMASREIAARLKEKGVDMLDAPVSGGEPKAISGTLSIMVGGDEDVFYRYLPVLKAMGSSITYCGAAGAGNVTKLCNQIVVAVNIAAVSEALVLGQTAGVSPAIVFKAIRGGLAGSTVMEMKAPMMLERNFQPGFKLDLHQKDLNNVLKTAKATGAPVILSQMVTEMMKELRQSGEGQSDHSVLVKYYERLAGAEVHTR